MQFWKELYRDERKNVDMMVIKDELTYNYPIEETEGPTFKKLTKYYKTLM